MEVFKPFRQIPWDRDYGEISDCLPTLATTTFFNPSEKTIMQSPKLLDLVENGFLNIPQALGTERHAMSLRYLGNWLAAPNSDKRRKERRALESYLEQKGIDVFEEVLDQQAPHSPLQPTLSELRKSLERRYLPPSYLTQTILYINHRIEHPEDYESVKEMYRAEMRNTFRKADNNILFQEGAYGIFYNNMQLFSELLQRYGSYRKVRSHMVFVLGRNIKPTSEGNDLVAQSIDILVRKDEISAHIVTGNEEFAFQWMIAELIDELLDDRYRLNFVFEKGSEKYRLPTVSPQSSAEEIMRYMNLMVSSIEPRNRTMAEQLVELDQQLDPNEKTNILMIVGSDHKDLTRLLPHRLQKVTKELFG